MGSHGAYRVIPTVLILALWACGGSEPESSERNSQASSELLAIAEDIEATLAQAADGETSASESAGIETAFAYPTPIGMTPIPTPTPTATPQVEAEPTPGESPTETPAEEIAPPLPPWSYEGDNGPEFWGQLSEVCAPCSEGEEQSPIDLVGAEGADLANPVFHYGESKIQITNNGHTVQVNVEPGNSIELDGIAYELLQFHLHVPSEHKIGGESFPGEMHFVHRNAEGELAVVAVLIDRGTKNEAMATIFKYIPSDEGMEIDFDGPAMIETLLPQNRTAFRYDGSLTTPPCTEGVKWVVLEKPMGVAVVQWRPFEELLHGNSRPVQPLNERAIQLDNTP